MVFDPSTVPASQKLTLTLDSTPISADQTDFPLTVILDGTNPLHAAVFAELTTGTPFHIGVAAADIYVSTTGDDVTGDGSFGNPYASLSHATANSSPGDVIALMPGAYTETVSVTLPHSLMIISSTGDYRDVVLTTANVYRSAILATGDGTFVISKITILGTDDSGTYPSTIYGADRLGSHLIMYGVYYRYLGAKTDHIPCYNWDGIHSRIYNCVFKNVQLAMAWAGSASFIVVNTITDKQLGQNISNGGYNCFPNGSGTSIDYTTYGDAGIFVSADSAELKTGSPCLGAGCGLHGRLETLTYHDMGCGRLVLDVLPRRLAIQAGGVQLPVEVGYWDAANEKAVLYTKVPDYAHATDGELILSYDSSQDDNDNVGLTGEAVAQAVWDSGFDRVYHHAASPVLGGACLLDSTANARHAAPLGGMTPDDLVAGPNGSPALDFDGINDNISSPGTVPNGPCTVLIAFNYTVHAVRGLITSGSTQLQTGPYVLIGNDAGVIRTFAAGTYANVGAVNTGQWYILSAARSPSIERRVLNAAFVDTRSVDQTGNVTQLFIGVGHGGYSNVKIGEVRVSNVQRSDDWEILTHLSLTDQLVTWSADAPPPSGGALSTWLEQPYAISGEPLVVHLEQPYTLAAALSAHLEQPYSFLLQAYLIQHYGDARQLRAWLVQYYRDAPQLRAWLTQYYGDPLQLAVHLEQPWQMSMPLLVALAQHYGIAAEKLSAFVEQLYHLHQHPQLAAHLLQPYLVGDLERTSHEFTYEITLAGVAVSPHVVNWDFRRSRFYGTIEMRFKHQHEALLAVDGAPVVFVFGTTAYRFRVEGGWRETSSWGQVDYSVTAHSATKWLGSPWAAPLTGPIPDAMASVMLAALCEPYSLTVDYQLVDEFLSGIVAEDEAPIDLIRRLLPDQAVLQSGPEGDVLYVQWDEEVVVPQYRTVTPAATLDDLTGFVSTSETTDAQQGHNSITVTDQQTAEDNSNLVAEQLDGRTMEVRLYLSPWADATTFVLRHTGGSHVTIEPFGVRTRTESETVEIVDGSGRTRYPIDAVLSTGWLRADLGAVSAADDGIIEAQHKRVWDAGHENYSGGDSLLAVTYRTRFWRWLVRSPRIEQVQVVALRETDEVVA